MHTIVTLREDVSSWGVAADSTVMIHSSMRSIGQVQGRADSVLDVLQGYFAPGLLVLPTHTWASINADGDIFDVESSPSCVGVLPEIFRKRNGVVRSWHPDHSVAAVGTDAQEFTEGEQTACTPCPRDGAHGKLLDRDGYIVFLGAPMTKNTFVHGVEEWERIPNRLASEPTQLAVRAPDGRVFQTPLFRHSAPIEDVSSNYGKLQGPLKRLGMIREAKFGDATVLITTARGVNSLVAHLLRKEPDLFLSPDPVEQSLLDEFVPPEGSVLSPS